MANGSAAHPPVLPWLAASPGLRAFENVKICFVWMMWARSNRCSAAFTNFSSRFRGRDEPGHDPDYVSG
ncbi:MAG: hypothetical protein IRZ04_14235 [Rhodospirillales bacterium]|nr:hypothetical protein [Rhodospirillales bacterium]